LSWCLLLPESCLVLPLPDPPGFPLKFPYPFMSFSPPPVLLFPLFLLEPRARFYLSHPFSPASFYSFFPSPPYLEDVCRTFSFSSCDHCCVLPVALALLTIIKPKRLLSGQTSFFPLPPPFSRPPISRTNPHFVPFSFRLNLAFGYEGPSPVLCPPPFF